MCGGAIISDILPLQSAGKKLTTQNLWAELDNVSDLLGLDYPITTGKNVLSSDHFDLKFPLNQSQLSQEGNIFFYFNLCFQEINSYLCWRSWVVPRIHFWGGCGLCGWKFSKYLKKQVLLLDYSAF
uniref:Uncharacterized protein MANES_15G009900 n=1 Tax=Rhizophora mucronata TaxID=61149 RepID=A0A2P2MTP5_RHIMU